MKENSRIPYIIRGVLAIILGLFVLFWPGITVEIVSILFAVFILANGLLLIGISFLVPAVERSGMMPLVLGVLLVIGGVFGIINPFFIAIALTALIAVLAILSGLTDIWVALTAMGTGGARILLGLSGALSVILGGIFIVFPLLGAVVLVAVYIGIFAIAIGALSIFAAFIGPATA